MASRLGVHPGCSTVLNQATHMALPGEDHLYPSGGLKEDKAISLRHGIPRPSGCDPLPGARLTSGDAGSGLPAGSCPSCHGCTHAYSWLRGNRSPKQSQLSN